VLRERSHFPHVKKVVRWPRRLRHGLFSPASTLGSWLRHSLETLTPVCADALDRPATVIGSVYIVTRTWSLSDHTTNCSRNFSENTPLKEGPIMCNVRANEPAYKARTHTAKKKNIVFGFIRCHSSRVCWIAGLARQSEQQQNGSNSRVRSVLCNLVVSVSVFF
jgi:hypothetical protein